MTHLLKGWGKLKNQFAERPLALFLDYDGTLTEIARAPEKAILSFDTRKLLKRLIKNSKLKLAIISGRSLEDIKRMVNIAGIVYVGNHGLEIEGPNIRFENPVSARYRELLKRIKNEARLRLSGFKGVLIEDKGFSLSIHYRLADKSRIPQIKTILHEATILYAVKDRVKVTLGKKVFEITPSVEWDKGRIVLWLLARWKFSMGGNILPVYIGDDVTDEDAFRQLKNKGVTIFVGRPKKTMADYYLRNPQEVRDFLGQIEEPG